MTFFTSLSFIDQQVNPGGDFAIDETLFNTKEEKQVPIEDNAEQEDKRKYQVY